MCVLECSRPSFAGAWIQRSVLRLILFDSYVSRGSVQHRLALTDRFYHMVYRNSKTYGLYILHFEMAFLCSYLIRRLIL